MAFQKSQIHLIFSSNDLMFRLAVAVFVVMRILLALRLKGVDHFHSLAEKRSQLAIRE